MYDDEKQKQSNRSKPTRRARVFAIGPRVRKEQTPECDASAVAGHGDCPASLVVGATRWPGEAYCGAGDFEPPSDATYCGFDQVLHPSPCRFRPSCCDEALKRYGFEVRVRVKDEL